MKDSKSLGLVLQVFNPKKVSARWDAVFLGLACDPGSPSEGARSGEWDYPRTWFSNSEHAVLSPLAFS